MELNILNFQTAEIIKDSWNIEIFENSFVVFETIDNIFLLIYATIERDIIFYNLKLEKKIYKIKDAHQSIITNFRHINDPANKNDLLLSNDDNNIKIWNLKDRSCLREFKKNDYYDKRIFACFLVLGMNTYIAISNYNKEGIVIIDLEGNQKKKLVIADNEIYLMKSYYFNKKDSPILLISFKKGMVSYNFDHEMNESVKIFKDKNKYICYSAFIIFETNNSSLVSSCQDGDIRIWNYINCEIITRIKISNNILGSISLWKNNFFKFIICCEKNSIKLIDIKKKKL